VRKPEGPNWLSSHPAGRAGRVRCAGRPSLEADGSLGLIGEYRAHCNGSLPEPPPGRVAHSHRKAPQALLAPGRFSLRGTTHRAQCHQLEHQAPSHESKERKSPSRRVAAGSPSIHCLRSRSPSAGTSGCPGLLLRANIHRQAGCHPTGRQQPAARPRDHAVARHSYVHCRVRPAVEANSHRTMGPMGARQFRLAPRPLPRALAHPPITTVGRSGAAHSRQPAVTPQ